MVNANGQTGWVCPFIVYYLGVYRFTKLFCQVTSGAFGVQIFRLYRFTDLILCITSGASGGPFFRCTTKEWGERRAKGLQSRPLESGFYTGE